MGNAGSRSARSVVDGFEPVDRKPLKKISGEPGVPAYLGDEPPVAIEELQLIRVDTREGFTVFCQIFGSCRPAQLRDHVLCSCKGMCLEDAIKGLASDNDPSATAGPPAEDVERLSIRRRRSSSSQSAVSPLQFSEPAMSYLRRLAQAAARDAAVFSEEEAALEEVEVFVELHDADTNQRDAESTPEPAAKACMLCGEEAGAVEGTAGGYVPCACSRGHVVCVTCLRQYVLHTHGLQSGSAALRCLAFDESVGRDGHARSRRCQGRYSDAALDTALRPTEALALRVADQMAGQRRLDRASIPFACVRCGCEDRVSRAVLERASARPHAVRRIRLLRLAGIPLIPARRSRLLTPAIRCPNAHCKATYCCKCGKLHHKSAVCSPDPQDTTFMEWVRGRRKAVQACPKCGMAIEKRGGCKYMLCPRNAGGCGHEFCWLCRGTYLGLHKCGKLAQDYEL